MATTLLQRYIDYWDPQFHGREWKGFSAGNYALAGRGWAAPDGLYRLYRGVDSPDDIDFEFPVGALAGGGTAETATISTYPTFPLPASSILYFSLRAAGLGGVEEAADSEVVRIETDALGVPIARVPNPAQRFIAIPKIGGKILLTWSYESAGQQIPPSYFNIYHDNGTGTVSYVAAIGTSTGRSYLTGAYADGTDLIFSIRSASVADDENTTEVITTVEADAAGPPDLGAPTVTYGDET